MSLGSGLSAQVGLAEEATYGTFVVPTRFLPFESESLSLDIARDEFANSIGESVTVLRSDRWTVGARNVKGDLEYLVTNRGFGMLFRAMLGGVAITTPGGGTLTRDHTHTLATQWGRHLTIQVGRPSQDGVVRAFSYLGCKIAEWELSNTIKGFLGLSLTIDGRDESTVQTLAAASYPAGATPHNWTGGTITVAGVAFPLRSITIAGVAGLEGERYVLGSALKSQPIQEALVEITGEIEADFVDLTAYNRFVTGTPAAVVATWQGPLIEGALHHQVVVTLPVCRFDGATPHVEGHGRLTQKLAFKALSDGAQQPITLLYRTTDTAS